MVENDTNRSLIVNKHFRYKYAQGTSRPSGYQLFNSYHYYNISLFLNIITLTLKNRSVSMGYEVFYEYAAEPKKNKLTLKFP